MRTTIRMRDMLVATATMATITLAGVAAAAPASAAPSSHEAGSDNRSTSLKDGLGHNDAWQAQSDPDGDENGGVDQPGGAGGVNVDDQDGNNGSGNDSDCEDDNRGKGVPGHCKTIPPVYAPPADVPPADAPPVDVPPVCFPPVDVPPVDVPPADAPPVEGTPDTAPPAEDIPQTDSSGTPFDETPIVDMPVDTPVPSTVPIEPPAEAPTDVSPEAPAAPASEVSGSEVLGKDAFAPKPASETSPGAGRVAPAETATAAPASAGQVLPNTGAPESLALLTLLGSAGIGAGLVLMRRGRTARTTR